MTVLVVLPILVPLVTAIGTLLAPGRTARAAIAVLGTAGLLAAALALLARVWNDGIQATAVGGWPAPFGIALVADLLAAIMICLAGIVGVAVVLYSLAAIERRRERFGYHALVQVLLMGVCGAFLAGDVFNLYVWYEVMLIASFVLLTLGGRRGQMEGGVKYVTLNLMASALFLASAGLLYGFFGTLNMADLAINVHRGLQPGLVTTVSILFLVAFGIKAAIFPLFFWLPASYHTPALPVSALFAGLLTKVGVYSLIRVFTLIFVGQPELTHRLILAIAGLTMVVGVLGAATQMEIRRILSFHIVSQIGYMIMGLGLFTRLALAGSVFYLIHHIIVKTNLFLIGGLVFRLRGTYQLSALGGLSREAPWLAGLFLVAALSLAGIPPLSGFVAKLTLVRAGLEAGSYVIVAAALAVSLLTLYSMTKIWGEVFWKDAPWAPAGQTSPGALRVLPVTLLAALTVAIGLGAGPAFALADRAAAQLLDRDAYVRAVLGAGP
jgi:multicomponent Na+:H+ antiporter subunit D